MRRFFLATTTKPWSSTAPPADFRPYVDASSTMTEFSWRAVILGSLFGILFGAVSVYVGLRAGLTVSASIPISVLSISILRAFGKSTILENNIVQTTGSAGESVAAGVIFTLPALIFLGFSLNTEYWRVFFLALIGGWLGVLFMIPLRRQLIVKEHGNLLFPEGTACADVLVAGDRGGSFAGRVFWGLGIGGVYTWMMTDMKLWTDQPEYQPKWFPGSSIRTAITSEYLGVGYIIGPRIAGTLFAGGVFSWLVLMPAIRFFGQNSAVPLYPSTIPINQMSPDQLWITYIRPMGAGAVAECRSDLAHFADDNKLRRAGLRSQRGAWRARRARARGFLARAGPRVELRLEGFFVDEVQPAVPSILEPPRGSAGCFVL